MSMLSNYAAIQLSNNENRDVIAGVVSLVVVLLVVIILLVVTFVVILYWKVRYSM
jgi:hypothetical protein